MKCRIRRQISSQRLILPTIIQGASPLLLSVILEDSLGRKLSEMTHKVLSYFQEPWILTNYPPKRKVEPRTTDIRRRLDNF